MNYIGSKFTLTQHNNVKELAKIIKKRILEEAPEVKKVSVRVERYKHIDICIKECDEAYQVIDDNGFRRSEKGSKYYVIKNAIENICKEYNYDNSDSITDYYDYKFTQYITYDFEILNSFRKKHGLQE